MKQEQLTKIIQACTNRRTERRKFMRMAGGAGVAVAGGSFLAGCDGDDDFTMTPPTPTPTMSPTPTPTPGAVGATDILTFALNLEYLEAEFYSMAAFGESLDGDLAGDGAGDVMGGAMVDFSGEPVIGQYAREIAMDERKHVALLRSALDDAGVDVISRPALNISGDADGAFGMAAAAAGVANDDGTFNPYANPTNFLLGAYLFEDVGVTAYQGSAAALMGSDYLESAAGLLSAEAYHAGLVRTLLYRMGLENPDSGLIGITDNISDARDSLDGDEDLDQGLGQGPDDGDDDPDNDASNLVPTNENAIVFGRTPQQVLNIVYLTAMAETSGGFFPEGVNGAVNMSGGMSGDDSDG